MIDTSVWVWAGRATAVNEDLQARAQLDQVLRQAAAAALVDQTLRFHRLLLSEVVAAAAPAYLALLAVLAPAVAEVHQPSVAPVFKDLKVL